MCENTASFKTLREDPRYPFQNQTKCCYDNYCWYFKCRRLLGEEEAGCNLFKKYYETICPNVWIEKWDDQRERGAFPGRI